MVESGFIDLIPVIPPGATMAPTSNIAQESIGKIPGRRNANGMWVGYNWHTGTADLEQVRTWARWGSNVGLRTDRFPCVDIDCADPALAKTVETIALATLGPAPVRMGNAPKRALAYRLGDGTEPFGRLRLWIEQGDKKYLVEILGEGQQYVVHGVHPKTGKPYTWDREPSAPELSRIDLAAAQAFLEAVRETAEMMGYECKLEGDGRGLASRPGDKKYLVEILGEGQQYVVYGVHPKTGKPYTWDREPSAPELSRIDLLMAKEFLMAVIETAEMMGYECKLEGDGRGLASRPGDQDSLLAPSIEELRKVVDLLPNNNAVAETRNDWLRYGAAIKAAAGEAEEREAADLFVKWSMKWEGNDRFEGNDPDDARENFRRIKPPFAVGWPFLAEQAREYGYDDSPFEADEEPAETTPTTAEEVLSAIFLSDQWLATKVVQKLRGVTRFIPSKEMWIVWNGSRWQPDAEMMAEDLIKIELRRIAAWVDQHGAAKAELQKAGKEARDICSSGKLTAVMRLVKSDRAIAVAVESLDHDSWVLNTPGGIVDLKTGEMRAPDPDHLCTRSTAVTPVFEPAPRWQQFLEEATRGDKALQGYLQRLAGYCLTGSVREHVYAFLYGEGGNGKGVFINTLSGVYDSYHRDSPMDTFVASNNDRHPTELAALAGARFVTASETQEGKRWDEAKLKRLTGGDPVTARGMRENFFTFDPQFKLVFAGNHKPEIRNLDKATRRRTHLVPFTNQPAQVDTSLEEKLEAEWPQILGWAIEGCLEWQVFGLQAPPSVRAATEEYFEENDPTGAWLAERTTAGWAALTSTVDLFSSWKEFANERNFYVGHINRFTAALRTRGFLKKLEPTTRRSMIAGLTLTGDDLKGLTAE